MTRENRYTLPSEPTVFPPRVTSPETFVTSTTDRAVRLLIGSCMIQQEPTAHQIEGNGAHCDHSRPYRSCVPAAPIREYQTPQNTIFVPGAENQQCLSDAVADTTAPKQMPKAPCTYEDVDFLEAHFM